MNVAHSDCSVRNKNAGCSDKHKTIYLYLDVREQSHPHVGEDVDSDPEQHEDVEQHARGVRARRQDLVEARNMRRQPNDSHHSQGPNQGEDDDVMTFSFRGQRRERHGTTNGPLSGMCILMILVFSARRLTENIGVEDSSWMATAFVLLEAVVGAWGVNGQVRDMIRRHT